MRPVDTDALQSVAPALGIGNPHTVLAPVDFDDGTLQQVLDVAPLIRRGRSVARSTGVWTGIMRVAATAGATNSDDLNPYALGTQAKAAFPSPVPQGFDVWILDVQAGGLQNVDWAVASILYPAAAQAFGTAAPINHAVAVWTGAPLVTGLIFLTPALRFAAPVRVPPGAQISVEMKATGGGSGVVDVTWIIGLFPAGLGQDGVGGY